MNTKTKAFTIFVIVLAGGFIGSKFGAFKLDHDKIIIIIVAAVVAVAGIELTIKLLAKSVVAYRHKSEAIK
jgi:uncharacterized membrane protein YfcA